MKSPRPNWLRSFNFAFFVVAPVLYRGWRSAAADRCPVEPRLLAPRKPSLRQWGVPRLVPAAGCRRICNRQMDLGEMAILKRRRKKWQLFGSLPSTSRLLPRAVSERGPAVMKSQDPVHRAPRSAAECCAVMKKERCGNEGWLAGNARTARAYIQ